jgi:CRISPR-associated exonuclease Cas4
MAFSEDDYIHIAALQHFVFCPRQWGLIHLEQQWAENRLTAEGQFLHRRADEPDIEVRKDAEVHRAFRLSSSQYGLTGIADVVEFDLRNGQSVSAAPVEYKRGESKTNDCDRLQLCAQCLCLEEMTGLTVGQGYLFYGKIRRREAVEISAELRESTLRAISEIRGFMEQGKTPPPRPGKHCQACSLKEICGVRFLGSGNKLKEYIASLFEEPHETP